MIIIGLTGSVGMGKTEAGKYFKRKNIDVFDCDKEIAALYKKELVLKQLKNIFPGVVINGSINKIALTKIVFSDKNKLKSLQNILYNLLKKKQSFWIRKKIREKKRIVVLDVPLLLESNNLKKYDLIVVVSSSKSIQRKRVLERKNWDSERLAKVLEKQITDKEKVKLANVVIKTDRGKRYLYNAIIKTKKMVKIRTDRPINKILKEF